MKHKKPSKQNIYQIEKGNLEIIQKDFLSESCNKEETLSIIKKNYEENDMVLDPHTAIGVGAAQKLSLNDCVVLSTAHPCKFPDAILKAINLKSDLPDELKFILDEEENYGIIENSFKEIKQYILGKIK